MSNNFAETILIVDDHDLTRFWLKSHLKRTYNILEAGSSADCLDHLSKQRISAILLDLVMPDVIDFELCNTIRRIYPDIPIIFVSCTTETGYIVNAIKQGAKDYIFKEDIEKRPQCLLESIKKVLEESNKKLLYESFKSQQPKHLKTTFIPPSPHYFDVYSKAIKAVRCGLSLILLGETGTGKDTLASYIHEKILNTKPFVTINCGAICKSLSESELFGFEKGSFTGAEEVHKGKIELSHGGILFLDEIGNMPMDIQEKLLCVLEKKELYRIGGTKPIRVDFTVISATNKNLEKAIENGEFREDLYYRINQLSLTIPSLREVPEVLPHYINYFIDVFNEKYNTSFVLPESTFEDYLSYPWKGNIRELKNKIQTTIALFSQGDEDNTTLPIQQQAIDLPPLNNTIEKFEQNQIKTVLKNCDFNISKAARKLGLHRSTLQGKMRKYQI